MRKQADMLADAIEFYLQAFPETDSDWTDVAQESLERADYIATIVRDELASSDSVDDQIKGLAACWLGDQADTDRIVRRLRDLAAIVSIHDGATLQDAQMQFMSA